MITLRPSVASSTVEDFEDNENRKDLFLKTSLGINTIAFFGTAEESLAIVVLIAKQIIFPIKRILFKLAWG